MFRSSPFALFARFVVILAVALPLAPAYAADALRRVAPSARVRVQSTASAPVVARPAPPFVHAAPAMGATFAPTMTTTYTGTTTQGNFVTTLANFESGPERYRHTATRLQDGTVLVTGGSNARPVDTAVTYDPATGRWTPTGKMRDSRFKHTATMLLDGGVLLTGGYNGSDVNGGPYLNTAELYDPATRTFSAVGTFSVRRENHTATRLLDGRVLITGGHNAANQGRPLATSELYDPITKTFTRTGELKFARNDHTATLLSDGRVLVVGGGYSTNSAELYDPATGTWTLTGAPIQNRVFHTATLLADGRVLVVVGGQPAAIYDPATATWTPTGAMAGDYGHHTATLLADGKVLVAGGQRNDRGQTSAEVFDPATDQWTPVASLHDPRMDHAAALLDDGTVLVVSGINRVDPAEYVTRAERFDPATQTWSLAPAWAPSVVPEPNGDFAAALLGNGTVFLSDGSQASIYDPAQRRYTPLPEPLHHRHDHSTTVLDDGSVLLAGGVLTPATTDGNGTAERFMPATRTFTLTGSLRTARYAHTATLLHDGRVLIAGGSDGNAALRSAELYDPATGTFTTTGAMHQPRASHSATLLDDGTVLVVGSAGLYQPASAEIYDPATARFEPIASVPQPINGRTVTRLHDGTVLFVGGRIVGDQASRPYKEAQQAEIYDPATRAFSAVGSMEHGRFASTATILDDGTVLIVGGEADNPATYSALDNLFPTAVESYNPVTRTFAPFGAILVGRSHHTATLLDDGSLFIFGGKYANNSAVRPPELGMFTTNTFGGTLTVPDGWLNATSIYTVSATTTDATIYGGSINGRPRFDLAPGVPITQTVSAGPSGSDLPLTLRLRDVAGVSANVISTTADYDFIAPSSTLTPLPAFSPTTFDLTWSGTDAHSGIGGYDLEVRNATAGTAWTPLLTNTTALSTTFTGVRGADYRFRVRAHDVAGNVEAWPTPNDGSTTVDSKPPASGMQPLATISPPTFTLRWSGQDETSDIAGYDLDMRVGRAGPWTPVLTNTLALSTTFTGVRGTTYQFRVRATDDAGNVEAWPGSADTQTVVDPDPPQSSVTALPPFSPATFVVRWTTEEAISGIVGYDLDVRDNDGAWTPLLTNTLALFTTFTGQQGHTYQFRVRATDDAGNVEPRHATFDTRTEIDVDAPEGAFLINDAALATTGVRVTLRILANDTQSGVEDMRVASDGTWGAWQPHQQLLPITLSAPDGDKVVGVQFRDVVGNVSDTVTEAIRLDRSVEQNPILSIDDDAVYTTVPTVTLAIGAPLNTKEMQISNNGSFRGAVWVPFDTTALWTLSTYGAEPLTRIVRVRTRDIDGTIHPQASADIIYDPLPPEGSVAITKVTASAVEVRVDASDNGSRKDQLRMRLGTDPQFSGASWQPYAATANVARTGTDAVRVYAQFEDAAGNRSAVGCTTEDGGSCAISGGFDVFLPLVRR